MLTRNIPLQLAFILSLIMAISCKNSNKNGSDEDGVTKSTKLEKKKDVEIKVIPFVATAINPGLFSAETLQTPFSPLQNEENLEIKKLTDDFKSKKAVRKELVRNVDVVLNNGYLLAVLKRSYKRNDAENLSDHSISYYDVETGKKLSAEEFLQDPKNLQIFLTHLDSLVQKQIALYKTESGTRNFPTSNSQSKVKDNSANKPTVKSQSMPPSTSVPKVVNQAYTLDEALKCIVFSKDGSASLTLQNKIYSTSPKVFVPSFHKIILNKNFVESYFSKDLLEKIYFDFKENYGQKLMEATKFDRSPSLNKQNRVALTLDDGPVPLTNQVLDMLKREQAKATFYVVGSMVKEHPEILKRIIAEGHEIGNHSWNHPNLATLPLVKLRAQIEDTNKIIYKTIGQVPATIRPPYGAMNSMVRQFADLPIILWSVDSNDWKYRNTPRIINVMSAAVPHDIILGHDIHATTVNALPTVVSNLKKKNMTFVSIGELLGHGNLMVGKDYHQKTNGAPSNTATVTKNAAPVTKPVVQ